jgi:hypothetical protein
MKSKVSRPGSDFRGALDYDQRNGKTKKAIRERPFVRHLDGVDDADVLRKISEQRPDINKPVQKFALSLTPGERMTDDQWRVFASDFMEGMELSNHPFCLTFHSADMPHDGKSDVGCEHVHLTVSRISYSGEVWLGRFSQERASKLCSELEVKHSLIQTAVWKPRSSIEIAPPTKSEIDKAVRLKKIPPRMQIQKAIDVIIAEGALTWEELAAELDTAGIDVTLQQTKGEITGCSFSHRESSLVFSGRNGLGSNYSAKKLQLRMMSNEQTSTNRSDAERVSEQIVASEETRNQEFAHRTIQCDQQIPSSRPTAIAVETAKTNIRNVSTAPLGFSRIEELADRGNDWVDRMPNFVRQHHRVGGVRKVHQRNYRYPAYFIATSPHPIGIGRSDGGIAITKFETLTDQHLSDLLMLAANGQPNIELNGSYEFCLKATELAERMGMIVTHPYQTQQKELASANNNTQLTANCGSRS